VRPDRGASLAEILVATCILSFGLVAVATGFQYATSSADVGRGETIAVFLAEQRIESLKSAALADWSSSLLAAGARPEPYGMLADAPRHRRQTVIDDYGGADCADAAPAMVTCKRVRVTVYYRSVAGGAGIDQERRVDLVTVLVARS
jgi:hypothetical protein